MLRKFTLQPHHYVVEAVAFEGEPPRRTTVADSASAMSIYVERLGEMNELDEGDDDPDYLGVVRILRRSGGEWRDVTDWCIKQHEKAGKYLDL